jgi:hypothetical protein
VVALVTLDGDAAARLAAGIGIPADPATMPHDGRVRAEIQAAVDAVDAHFARSEQIKRFAILDRASSNPRASSRRQWRSSGRLSTLATTRSWTASTRNPMPWCRTGATRSVPIRLDRRIQVIGKAGR